MSAYVNNDNTQSRPDGAYAKVIDQIAKDGVCPFCPENLTKYHKKPLEQRRFWTVTDNMYPYKPSKQHRLLIHREHITDPRELSPEAWSELLEIFKEETASRSISGGTFVMRFGDTKFTGASVSHLHAHIVQSDPDDTSYDKTKGLTMRIG